VEKKDRMRQAFIRWWPFPVVFWIVLVQFATSAEGQTVSQSAPIPPAGQLVDVGGWRLHLHCTGEAQPSQPTVILEAGLGDFSVEWSLVQPKLATFVRVCSYDRAGTGWSELGPHPRTMQQIAYELHVLLEKAKVAPPYVLVGHSYGGWLVRLYASRYRSEIAGMVLLEGGFDNPWRMVNGTLVRAEELTTGKPIPDVKTSGPLRESDIPEVAMKQMQAGAKSLVRGANDPPRSQLPPDAQRVRTWVLSRWQHLAAAVNPVEAEELAILRKERASGNHPLGDMPLVVVTRGIADENGPGGNEVELERRKKEHAELAKSLSRNGRQVIAERSGHHVQIEAPEVVITSVRDVISQARK
jgi:pimeloyl-ACP methyl ester carboxylesterase